MEQGRYWVSGKGGIGYGVREVLGMEQGRYWVSGKGGNGYVWGKGGVSVG